jgi:hypothetical protein
MRQGFLLSSLLFSMMLEFLNKPIRQAKKWKQIVKDEIKVFLFPDDMTLYLKDPKNSTRKILDMVSTFRKVAKYKISI